MRQGWTLWGLFSMVMCVIGVSGGLVFDDHWQAGSGLGWAAWAWWSHRSMMVSVDTPVPRG